MYFNGKERIRIIQDKHIVLHVRQVHLELQWAQLRVILVLNVSPVHIIQFMVQRLVHRAELENTIQITGDHQAQVALHVHQAITVEPKV